jgi:hypothetical protein
MPGANNADLMRISYHLSKPVDATLASPAPVLEQSSDVYPALDMLARLNRQVQHLAELELRRREASARAQQAPAHRGASAGSREVIKGGYLMPAVVNTWSFRFQPAGLTRKTASAASSNRSLAAKFRKSPHADTSASNCQMLTLF